MPNPKAGTVTPDVPKAIGEIKKGKVEFRIDKLSNVHTVFGKVSFEQAKLKENLVAVIKAILDVKPASIKGIYIKGISVASTMGPGIPLDINAAVAEAK